MKPLFAVLRLGNVEPGWVWLWAVLILAGLGILVATYWGIFRRSERRLTWLLMLWRGIGLFALLLALAKPIWTTETQLVDAGRVAVVLDNSQSMDLPDPSGPSRYARATEAVGRLRQSLAGTGVEVEVFDITGTRLADNTLPKEPTVERTDLAQALSKTAAGLRFKPLNGVVLISDGMDNTGREDFQDLADIANGRPIFTVGFKAVPTADNFDLALRFQRPPRERVMVNNDLKVDLVVTKTGGPRLDNVSITLVRGLNERFAEQKITLPEGNAEQSVSLTLKPSQPGTFEFSAVVASDRAEQNLANNSVRFPLRVDAEAIRVLYLEGFLRYEYKYLKNLLEDDPDLNVDAIVRRVNPDAAETRGQGLLTPDQLKKYDVIILGDMEATYLTAAEYQELLTWLEGKDQNKGTARALLVLGGYRSFGPAGFRTTKLADALPVVFADAPPYQSEEPFQIKLTEAGRAHPVFEVAGDRVKSEQAWQRAPKLAGCSLVRWAKPGAEVLAVDPNVMVEGKPAVIVATERYGNGRTMVITADTTWKWSRFPRVLGMADTLYARFWSQTVRWLAGRGTDEQKPLLAVSTDHPGYDVGKKVTITVTRQPRPGTDLSKSALAVQVAGPGAKALTVAMRSSSAQPDVFTGSYYPTVGGRYQAVAALTDGGSPLANQGTEFLVHGSNQEKANTGTNPESLRTLARASGGLYYDIEDVDKLTERLPHKERRTVQRADRDLWNSWWLFAIFLGAVSTEWLIRRRNHLI
jgi:uncharacterized membrane protein